MQVFRAKDHTLRGAAALFHRAAVVVGVHGAALANAVACRPRAALVELALPEPMYRHYVHLAAALDLAYWAVDDLGFDSFERANLTVSADRVAHTVRAALVAQREKQPLQSGAGIDFFKI